MRRINSTITRSQVLAMCEWCEKHDVTYAKHTNYPYLVKLARKQNQLTPQDVLYFTPDYYVSGGYYKIQRTYLVWTGQTRGDMSESLAYIMMTSYKPVEATIIRASRASWAAAASEPVLSISKRNPVDEVEAMHSLVSD